MAGQGKNRRGETCTQAYARNMTEVFDKLEKIKAHLIDNGTDCRKAHWGHVGSAEHINELLDNISVFIGLRQED